MIVQCAACQSRFKIADDKVTERGVKVRCTKCSTTFVVRKEPPPPAPEAAPVGHLSSANPPLQPGPSFNAVPTGGAPPAGFGLPNGVAARTGTSPPQKTSMFGGAAPPKPVPPQPSLARPDPFARFNTAELRPTVDPFSPSAAPGDPADPFAGIDLGSAPAQPKIADAPLSNLFGQGPDPLGSLGGGASLPRPEAPAAPAQRSLSDLFGPLPPAPVASAAPSRPGPVGSGDPFGSGFLNPAAPPAAARAPGPLGDPFANLKLDLGPAPAASTPTPAARSGAVGGLGFGGLDLGASAAKPPRSAGFDPAEMGGGSLDLEGAPGGDPFANIDINPRPAAPPPSQPAAQAGPAAPMQLGGNELDFDTSIPSGLELDAPPKPAPQAPAPSPAPAPRPEPRKAPAPARPASKPEPGLTLPPPTAEDLEGLPQTVLRSIKWDGKDVVEVSAVKPVTTAAARPAAKKGRKRRSTASALLNAFIFAAAGLAFGAGAVSTRLASVDAQELGVGATVKVLLGGAAGDLAVSGVTNGLYRTRAGRDVFVIHGRVSNRSSERKGPIRLVAQLHRGSSVAREAEGVAGQVPTPEDLHGIANPAKLAELNDRLLAAALPLDPGAEAEFAVVFYEYPDDLSELEIALRPDARPAPAKAAAPAPRAEEKAAAPAAAPGPAPEAEGGLAALPAKAPAKHPGAAAPASSAKRPARGPLRVISGTQKAGGTP